MARNESADLGADEAQRIASECYADILAYCKRHAPAGYEAADLAQETFLRFVRNGRYRDQGKPLAYLLTIARSVCIDAGRRAGSETVGLTFDVAEEPTPEGDPALACALDALEPELAEIVELRYGSDLNVGEVAHVLGISRFAVRRRLKRALAMLKEELEGRKETR